MKFADSKWKVLGFVLVSFWAFELKWFSGSFNQSKWEPIENLNGFFQSLAKIFGNFFHESESAPK